MNKSTSVILFLLSIGIFYTFIAPQYAGAKDLVAQADQYKSVLKDVSRIKEARDNLLSSYEAIPQTEKDRLAKALPDTVDAVGLARDLDTIASRYGLTISGVEVTTGATGGATAVLPEYALPYDKATISFSVATDYATFTKFLADLEKSLRIMDVSSLSFDVDEEGIYEHRLTVETYWLR
jgi:hypothetical protein